MCDEAEEMSSGDNISLRPGGSFFSSSISGSKKRPNSRNEELTLNFLFKQRMLEKEAHKNSPLVGNDKFSLPENLFFDLSSSRGWKNLSAVEKSKCETTAVRHCNKRYTLKSEREEYPLPDVNTLYSAPPKEFGGFPELKSKLNAIKGEAERGDDFSAWTQHTFSVNPAAHILPRVKNIAKPEFISQAFLKFFEVLNAFPAIAKDLESINSVHLCEAPGAFIASLNHYLSMHCPHVEWDWLANTLNPHYEGAATSHCITDDRIIIHTLPHWVYGDGGTGDITARSCLQEIKDKCNYFTSPVYLVTADGSIDCQGNPGEQEKMTSHLHLCEIVNALEVLHSGGTFVCKMFTFFEQCTQNLLYILCLAFKEVEVYKPITSKLGNSEVYLVCLKYKGRESIAPYLDKLCEIYGPEQPDNLLFADLPASFLSRVEKSAVYFMEHQIEAIERNVFLLHNKSEAISLSCSYLKELVWSIFTENNTITPIDKSFFMTKGSLEWDSNIHHRNIQKWVSHYDSMDLPKRLKYLSEQLEDMSSLYVNTSSVTNFKSKPYIFKRLSLSKGKPFSHVNTSRFCYDRIVCLYSAWLEIYLLKEGLSKENNSDIVVHIHTTTDKANVSYINGSESQLTCESRVIVSSITDCLPNSHIVMLCHDFRSNPSSSCGALNHALHLLQSGALGPCDSLCVICQPLMTRLQHALLCVISACFKERTLHSSLASLHSSAASLHGSAASLHGSSPSLHGSAASLHGSSPSSSLPVIVLKGVEEGHVEILSSKLLEIGFSAGDGAVMELMDTMSLIQSGSHSIVCRYNALTLLSWTDTLAKKIIPL